jgi:ribulose 1,5-bisphosphate carboxylase large subunit-like protein
MKKEEIVVTYHLSFQLESVERSVELLLAEMTSGIQYYSKKNGVQMDRAQDTLPFVDDSVSGEVRTLEQIDDDTYSVTFALPAHNLDVELGGITNLWPMVAGEVFNFHFIKRAALVCLDLPDSFVSHYKGPGYGITGIRDLVGVTGGPVFGSIIKPNLGLDPERSARTATILAEAGFNFIKDDEICVNPPLCPLHDRVRAVAEILERYRQRSGRNVLYAANVTSDFSVLGKAAEIAAASGAGGLMIDPFCTGMSAVDYLRRNFDMPIYIHRVGYGLFCSGPNFSIGYDAFSVLFRMLGADFSHVGGIWGKSESSRRKTAKYVEILRKKTIHRQAWPVVTGISIENMSDYHRFYGDDTLFMDHIDIYRDVESARNKLTSLKEKLAVN